ncbi:MAG: hypothetical protein N2747_00450 [Chitinophagaceae bacterium]|nr:hypothetical protein [Chitinophagaceae bacterium]
MARSIEEIFNDIMVTKQSYSELNVLNSTSKTAIYRLWIYIMAFCIWMIETMMEHFKKEMEDVLDRKRPHTLRWYAEKAKAFQYGFNLVEFSDYFDNTGYTEEQIQQSKIVRHAAAVETLSGVRIKVAKNQNGQLAPLNTTELNALKAYFSKIKDAGVKVNVTSGPPDELKISLKAIINPLVLNIDGSRIDGTEPQPVKKAIKNYLSNLPFNGIFSIQKLSDALQKVEGVEDFEILLCRARYGVMPFQDVDVQYQPDAGYMTIFDDDFNITYQFG